jgi:hypothetical protein
MRLASRVVDTPELDTNVKLQFYFQFFASKIFKLPAKIEGVIFTAMAI